MDLDEYISLIENPENVQAEQIADFRTMLEYAPYCANTRLLLLKALHKSHNIHYEAELPKMVLYAPSSAALYALLHPQKATKRRTQQHNGDYFDMLETMEKVGKHTHESLQEIAARLKAARQQLQKASEPISPRAPKQMATSPEISEENVRQYIKSKQYALALETLRKLNLNNPKKSIYFADQIRFLERALNINS